jgi:hypothetical protein
VEHDNIKYILTESMDKLIKYQFYDCFVF